MIEVFDLKKSFGETKKKSLFTKASTAVHAVAGVSFKAPDGKITGLLGPNGAGKTTTMRMLYTLMKPDSGRIVVDGVDAFENTEAVRRRLGVLPDSRGLYKRLTARENIEYFGDLQGVPKALIQTRIASLSERLEMSEILDRQTEGFSNGQRVKTGLARTLIHDPQNVILDEPTNGLDVMSTRGLRKVMLQLREEGKCVLFSSHIMQEVAALCDSIVVIAKGKVVASGTPDELRAQGQSANLEDAFVKIIGSDEGLMA
jgi:sodium transport system ATP-binding protein